MRTPPSRELDLVWRQLPDGRLTSEGSDRSPPGNCIVSILVIEVCRQKVTSRNSRARSPYKPTIPWTWGELSQTGRYGVLAWTKEELQKVRFNPTFRRRELKPLAARWAGEPGELVMDSATHACYSTQVNPVPKLVDLPLIRYAPRHDDSEPSPQTLPSKGSEPSV